MTTATELLTRHEAATFLKVSDRTLDRITDIPRVKIGGRRIVFRRADLESYVERCASKEAA